VWTQRRSAKVLPLHLPHDTALPLTRNRACGSAPERERPSPSRLPPTSSHTGFIARARTAQRSTLASRSLVFTPPRSVSCSLGATLAMNPTCALPKGACSRTQSVSHAQLTPAARPVTAGRGILDSHSQLGRCVLEYSHELSPHHANCARLHCQCNHQPPPALPAREGGSYSCSASHSQNCDGLLFFTAGLTFTADSCPPACMCSPRRTSVLQQTVPPAGLPTPILLLCLRPPTTPSRGAKSRCRPCVGVDARYARTW